ncbi:MAG: NAD(P)H-dependent oxidoreductase [Cyanobacteria bacterium J06623_7]
MTRILRIDSSSRTENSHSRQLADYFQTMWQQKHPDTQIVVRDLIQTPIPHLSDTAIAGFYTPAEQQTPAMQQETAISNELVKELQSSDILLVSVPMYNFSLPAALKAWIDQIVRIGETFAYDGTNFTGLVKVKRAYIICTYGSSGYVNGGAFSALNFLEPYLQGLLSFLGIKEIKFFHLQGTTADEATVKSNTQEVQKAIAETINAA